MDEAILQAVEFVCERLGDRNATLFLGAGINWGIKNNTGQDFPLGPGLADLICRDLLESDITGRPLDDVAEMARFRVGPAAVNNYIRNLFATFEPSTAHLALVQLPWNVLYSTNYDTLVERASQASSIVAAGNFRPTFSTQTSLDGFSENDILYYKLHGCVDFANTDEGRLILTKEDYRYYERHRRPLFRRLREDIINQTLVFVGYSLSDPNFRSIIENCREQLGATALPRSFAIRKTVSPAEAAFWQEKFNIQSLNCDAADFLNLLKGTWHAQKRSVTPFEERDRRTLFRLDDTAAFPKVGESFYRVLPQSVTGQSTAKRFFLGSPPSWADIRDGVAPPRDAYLSLFGAMLEELLDPQIHGNVYLVRGPAGTGKTTLLRSLAFELVKDSGITAICHIPGAPLDHRTLGTVFDPQNPRRIVVVIEHASEKMQEIGRFVTEIRRAKIPVTILLEERTNQWNAALSANSPLNVTPFDLGRVSPEEIDKILTALAKHDALGKLTGTDVDYQRQHFDAVAHNELLVALRELTSQSKFDDIVRDEFSKIPSQKAKDAYVFAAALGQLELPIRFEVLGRLVDVEPQDLGKQILQPTEGVLLSLEDFGWSRHNAGYRLQTRHPIIASVIFAEAAPDDDAKFRILTEIIEQLDPGFPEDARVLQNMVKRRELADTIASPAKRRALFDRLEAVLPDNPYVLQHRSGLERNLGDADAAIDYARAALRQQPSDLLLKNTLGYAYELKARDSETLESQAMLKQAEAIFDEGMKKQPGNPHGYLGIVQVMKQKARRETSNEKRRFIEAEILSLLEEGYEQSGRSAELANALADCKAKLGNDAEALTLLEKALKSKPIDSRVRDGLIRLYIDANELKKALVVAQDGIKYDSTNWRLQRHVAMLLDATGANPQAVQGHFDAALRFRRADPVLIAEYAAYLVRSGLLQEAKRVFETGRQLPIAATEKKRIRLYWQDGTSRRKVFRGRVHETSGAMGFILAIPENFIASFWRTNEALSTLANGDNVSFAVGFSANDCFAVDIRRVT